MSESTTEAGRIACFTTNASLRPGHRLIVPCGQSAQPLPPLPVAAQETHS
ncbi:UNVERIFIED_ORG: hypothetical protein M2420_001356 [Stenotrophomonas maltophilia]|jgi:hypothetical protein